MTDYKTKTLRQSVFNRIVLGLKAQGHPAVVRSGDGTVSCKYRTPEGDKCAAGQILPDRLYERSMESKPFRNVAIHSYMPRDEVFAFKDSIYPAVDMIQELQGAHDAYAREPDAEWLEHFLRDAKQIGSRYTLDTSACG